MNKNIKVGILSSKNIEMTLMGDFKLGDDIVTGAVSLDARNVKEPMHFIPVDETCSTEVKDVTIGVNFHWERKENQRFSGEILILPEKDELILVNILPIEDYLKSVISSEMSATSQMELLKAHAVISRSWVMAQIEGKKDDKKKTHTDEPCVHSHVDDETLIRWYDHDDHDLFDVCADDHCQRYQGITRQTTPTVAEAVNATCGEVLMSDEGLCDARFSKCCGGVMEQFEYCWADEPKSYLKARRDDANEEDYPDLRDEDNAREWILASPAAFCNTDDKRILSQVLNGYDQETADFYRWEVKYENDYLSDLILRRTGFDFGRIVDMVPIERGVSGRLSKLKIIGEKRTMTIGKELEIRRALSESHLYSSAFIVEKTPDGGFILKGAGWGHGVGLCQIGAAMMADKGYDYREILSHYYPGSKIEYVK